MEENKIEKLAEEFADAHERRGCAYWNGLYRGYIAGVSNFISSKRDVIKSVCDDCDGIGYFRDVHLKKIECKKCNGTGEQTVL